MSLQFPAQPEYDEYPTIKTIPDVLGLFKFGGRFEHYWRVDEDQFEMAKSWIYDDYYFDWAYWLHSVRLTDTWRDAADYSQHMDYERKLRDGEISPP